MTEEEFHRLGELTRAVIVEEIESRIGRVIAVAEAADTAVARTDALAGKLADVTAALVAADGAILERLDALERFAASFAPGNEYEHTRRALVDAGLLANAGTPPELKRRGLLSRLTRRKSPHQGAVPEGDE